jgi:hypothetical protein
MRIRSSVLAGFLIAAVAFAVETLTNDSILELHKLGLGDAVIMEKIKASSCKFDTSTEQLKKLKEAGISDNVIAAMIGASSTREAAVAAGDPNDPSAPHDPGIWLYENVAGKPRMTKIEPTMFAAIKAGPSVFAIYGGTSKARSVMSGAHARTQINFSRPVFYLYFEKTQSGLSDASRSATSPEDFTLTKMEVKEDKNERRVVIGKVGLYGGSKAGYSSKDVFEADHERLSPGVYKMVPKDDLPDGEYCILYTGSSTFVGYGVAAGGPSKGFCFGVNGGSAPTKQKH